MTSSTSSTSSTSTGTSTGTGPGLPDRAALRERAEAHLRALAGGSAVLRDDQWRAIEALVADHRRALVVQRTGWGKSAVYFVATALLRAQGAGPTVLISPLLALMRNQVAAAARAGIRAVTVNSTNAEDWSSVYADVAAGEVDVLLVSPERLNNPEFRDAVLPQLAATAGLLVVDEAHCISDWGHDFRPDYRRIATLLGELPASIPVLATTATANARVTADVAEQLRVADDPAADAGGPGARQDVLVLRGSLDRESLRLGVVRLPDHAHRLAWLTEHLPVFQGSGIIYTLTVAATVDVADHLRAHGFEVASYSGSTDPAARLQAEDDLLNDRVKALVATSALGMGFDKPNLGFVVHLGAPSSPVSYYQQVGRAGRGVDDATAVLLPGIEDRAVWDYFASTAFPPEADVREALEVLSAADRPLSTAALEARVPLRRSRLESMLKVLDVDGAVHRVKGGWVATRVPWSYDEQRYAGVAAARRREERAMLDYVATGDCRMQFLRAQLDDPTLDPCGRCDNCGGLTLETGVDPATLDDATRRLQRPGVPVEPRRQWPTGLAALGLDLKGRIPPAEQALTGRAVGRLTDLGLGDQLRALFTPGAADTELPVPLRRAVVAVLDDWEFEGGRPDAIALVRSSTRPRLVEHLAQGLARYTGLPLVAALAPRPDRPAQTSPTSSARRLAAVHGRFVLEQPGGPDAAGVHGRRVLLVDDRTDSGWTLTETARLLRLAGAQAVHPLVLATTT